MALKPRTAGILGMVAGLGVCIGGGALIARPAIWFLGVLVLVGGTILFSVAATWVVRSSWAPEDWPDASIPEGKRRRRLRRLSIAESALGAILIGMSVWQLVVDSGFQSWFYLGWGILILLKSVWTLRVLTKLERAESPVGS